MTYPSCERGDCLFESLGLRRTLMYSPILYDKSGAPIAGGSNEVTEGVRCRSCKKIWDSKSTELKRAQGIPLDWKEATR